jgi:hypothetical protein
MEIQGVHKVLDRFQCLTNLTVLKVLDGLQSLITIISQNVCITIATFHLFQIFRLCSRTLSKMTTPQEMVQFVYWFVEAKSPLTVQHNYWSMYNKEL